MEIQKIPAARLNPAAYNPRVDTAPLSQKRMILAEIIDRIEVGAGYKINIEFKLTARQFLEPDADAAGDQKVS